MISTILKAISLAIIAVFVAAFVVFIGIWFIAIIMLVFAVLGIAYAGNVPFVVNKNGKKVGYYTRKSGFVKTEQ